MKKSVVNILVSLGGILLFVAVGCQQQKRNETFSGRWSTGDFHNHTVLTDGSNTPEEVFSHAFQFGLDWIVNSEHGGAFDRNPEGQPWPTDSALDSPPDGKMWRWQSLWQYAFPIVARTRQDHADKIVLLGYEWNVPVHDHASVAIVGPAEEGGLAIARHAYLFDRDDQGTGSGNRLGVGAKNTENSHDNALKGVQWLADNYPATSYFLINHPSRWQNYSIAAIRDFNNAAPRVAFGFEGIPGHQKEGVRGGYNGGPFQDGSGNDVTYKARTYGGADLMIARVGGVWDALLGEGRRFFTFVNSDFHTTGNDFWPGEYAKIHAFVPDKNHDEKYSPVELLDGLRGGNSFVVHGDLLDGLEFTARCLDQAMSREPGMAGATKDRDVQMSREPGMAGATQMGETLAAGSGCDIQITIRFRSPAKNNNGDTPVVDHIDLIAGEVRGMVARDLPDGITPNPEYDNDTNETARVVATFTDKDWKDDEVNPNGKGGSGNSNAAEIRDGGSGEEHGRSNAAGARDGGSGWRKITFHVGRLDRNMYYRLRGTNLACGVTNETDEQCNPLIDELMGTNSAEMAYADLWFYSNPIFVEMTH